jgi:hypothetical protein
MADGPRAQLHFLLGGSGSTPHISRGSRCLAALSDASYQASLQHGDRHIGTVRSFKYGNLDTRGATDDLGEYVGLGLSPFEQLFNLGPIIPFFEKALIFITGVFESKSMMIDPIATNDLGGSRESLSS